MHPTRLVVAVLVVLMLAAPAVAQESEGTGFLDGLWSALEAEAPPGEAAEGAFQFLAAFGTEPSFGIGDDAHARFLGVTDGGVLADVSDYFLPVGLANQVPSLDPMATIDGVPIPEGWQAFGEEGPIEDSLGALEAPTLVWGVDVPDLDLTCDEPFAIGRAWFGDGVVSPEVPWEEGQLEADLPGHGPLAGASRLIEFSCFWGEPRVTGIRNHPDFGTRQYGPLGAIVLYRPGRVVFLNAARQVDDAAPAEFFVLVDEEAVIEPVVPPIDVVVSNHYEGEPSQVFLRFVPPEASGGAFLSTGVFLGTVGCAGDATENVLVDADGSVLSQSHGTPVTVTVSGDSVTFEAETAAGATTTKTADAGGTLSVETGGTAESCSDQDLLNTDTPIGPHTISATEFIGLLTGTTPAPQEPAPDEPTTDDGSAPGAVNDSTADDEGDSGSGLGWLLGILGFGAIGGIAYFAIRRRGDRQIVYPVPLAPPPERGPCWELLQDLEAAEGRLGELKAELAELEAAPGPVGGGDEGGGA